MCNGKFNFVDVFFKKYIWTHYILYWVSLKISHVAILACMPLICYPCTRGPYFTYISEHERKCFDGNEVKMYVINIYVYSCI